MRILTGLSGSLLALALVLTGCGSDDSEKEPKDSSSASNGDKSEDVNVDACKLLAAADLEEQFGSPFGDGDLTHQEETGGDQCVWTSTEAGSAETFSIIVLRQDGLGGVLETSGMSLAELFEQTKLAYPNAEAIDLGDEAYISVHEVQVLDGDTWYSLSFHGTSDTAVDGLKALAAQVAG